MCLYVKEGTTLRVAKKPITVWKILNPKWEVRIVGYVKGKGVSPYQGKTYTRGKSYRVKLDSSIYGRIYYGFHAWRTKKVAMEQNYNGYKNVVKCTLPVGAEYYIGKSGDIVSNRITIGEAVAGEYKKQFNS